MFMVNEIDRLLAGFLKPTNENENNNNNNSSAKVTDAKNSQDEIRIRLPDVKRIDVSSFKLESKVKWQPNELRAGHLNAQNRLDKIAQLLSVDRLLQQSNKRYVTSDLLFISSLNELVLDQLTKQTKEINLSGSRVLICDQLSYQLMLKLRRQLSNKNLFPASKISANLLYKKPFNFSAILTISDVVKMFEYHQKPLLYRRQSSLAKAEGYMFNYSLVRAAFPYLKTSHLTLLVMDKGELDYREINVNGGRDYLTIQLLNHFARSNQLIELKPLCKLAAIPHQIYNNVLFLIHPDEISSTSSIESDAKPLNKLNLSNLVYMAEQLIALTDRLRLHPTLIAHKQTDVYGQSRVLAQFVANKASNLDKNHIQGAKILVLDRLHSIRSGLAHADRYGAFLEQEQLYKSLGGEVEKLGVISQDKLDERLQLVPLTDLLSSIIEYTISLKLPSQKTQLDQPQDSRSAFGSSLSIQRHLNITKTIFNALNEGYLLLLKLESSLMEIGNDLARQRRNQTPPGGAGNEQFMRLVGEKIVRIGDAFKQLIDTSGKIIRVADLLRAGFILIDTLNAYLFLDKEQAGSQQNNKWLDALIELKRSLVSGRQIKVAFKNKLEQEQQSNERQVTYPAFEVRDMGAAFAEMDSVANRLISLQKINLDLDKTVRAFHENNLNMEQDYTSMKLSARKPSTSDIIILLLIGPITPNELSQLKNLESNWKQEQEQQQSKSAGDLLILTSGMVKSEDFLNSLLKKDPVN